MRRPLRTDVSSPRFLHSLTQFELAGAGLHVGATAEIEPPEVGGAGDVLLRTGDTEIFLEVATQSTDEAFLLQDQAQAAHHAHLRALGGEYGVSFDGDLPGRLDEPGEKA